jgi:hypothetical protein
MGMFRELAAERWRERFHASSEAPAEAIVVPESALVQACRGVSRIV